MSFRKERYWILSRGEAEKLPEVKETVIFRLQKKGEKDEETTEVPVITNYKDLMSSNQTEVRYGHIIGKTQINEEELPCEAKFQVNKMLPMDEKIGELVIRRPMEEI